MAVYEKVTENGVILVDAAVIRTNVEQEWMTASGASSAPSPATAEGRQIEAEVSARVQAARDNAKLANQINPNQAEGIFFDGVYSLTGGSRDAAERSTVDCVLTGVAGTVITATPEKTIQDTNNQTWVLVSDATIGPDNNVTASFRSSVAGVINAGANTITQIVTGVVGWETVTNPAAAVPGKLEQSVENAKMQRIIELGANSRSVAGSVIAAVNALEGVSSLSFRENNLNTPQTIDGVNIPAKSSWLCVDGGASSEIATAYKQNVWGTAFYGFSNTVTEQVTDTNSNQTFDVLVDRSTELPIKIEVTAMVNSTDNAVNTIKSAVRSYVNGQISGHRGLVLGEDVSPFEVSSAINQELSPSRIFVRLLRVTTVADDSFNTNTIPVDIWRKATVTDANIEVILA